MFGGHPFSRFRKPLLSFLDRPDVGRDPHDRGGVLDRQDIVPGALLGTDAVIPEQGQRPRP